MGRLSRRAAAVAVCAALTVSLSPSASNADDKTTLRARAAALRSSVAAIDAELDVAMRRFHEAEDALTTAIASNLAAEQHVREASETQAIARDAAASRIRALYMSGGSLAVVATVLRATDVHDALSRYHNATAVLKADQVQVDYAIQGTHEAEKAQERLHDAVRAQARAEKATQDAAKRLETLLAKQASLLAGTDARLRAILEAEAHQARMLAEAAMRAAAAKAQAATTATGGTVYNAPTGRYACPVGPVRSFVDTWHAPRSGGRQHQGTDVFAPWGSPAYAVVDGVIDKWGNGGLGGITLWLRAANGDRYYYAHNSVNIATVGTHVRAGDVIAKVGNTGNAATTPPHVHFEAHPGGGPAANPYPFLASICKR
ncbi:MAG TPA: peptidoglycan DD-metalloendopeptidase family protein [Frankiaceae bacterium]|nr:peptidoglycan DD-metalloendopeptidase family protein [Frankiaceae bacterium]